MAPTLYRTHRAVPARRAPGSGPPVPRSSLPDLHPIRRRQIHSVPWLNIERPLECVVVHQRDECAVLTWRVRVGEQLLAQRIVAHRATPDLRETHEEALIAGESI